MPICKSIVINDSTTVKVWHIQETESELMNSIFISERSHERLSMMKSEIHRKGFLAVRKLLNCFEYSDENLIYNNFGKPLLNDGKFISISHSFDYAAVVISDGSVGVDIEKLRPKISKLSSKFINSEAIFLNINFSTEIDRLTAIWTNKEALYKFYGKPGLSLNNNCIVLPFINSDSNGISWIVDGEQSIKCSSKRFKIDNYYLTIVCPYE